MALSHCLSGLLQDARRLCGSQHLTAWKKLLDRVLSMAVAFVFNDEIPRVATLAFFLDLLNDCAFHSFDCNPSLGLWALHESRVSSVVDGLVMVARDMLFAAELADRRWKGDGQIQ